MIAGKGYRRLKNGELIMHGDEVCPDGKNWYKSLMGGMDSRIEDSDFVPFRRKIKSKKKLK